MRPLMHRLAAAAATLGLALCALPMRTAAAATARTLAATRTATAYGAIAFPAAADGLVSASAGSGQSRILQSKDGGRTWQAVAAVSGDVEAFSFASATAGWLWTQGQCVRSTCPTALYATSNGGASWQRLAAPAGKVLAVDLASPATGYVETQVGSACGDLSCGTDHLWRTLDGGRTWTSVAVPGLIRWSFAAQAANLILVDGYRCPTGDASCQAVVVRSSTAGRGWATVLRPAGTNYQGNSNGLEISIHGTTAWFEAPIPGGGTMASGIGALYRSTDGGRTWIELAKAFQWGGKVLAGGPGFAAVPESLLPSRAFAVVGTGAGAAQGGLALTLDGGRSWVRLAGSGGREVYGAAWDGPNTIWLTGGDGPLGQSGGGYLVRVEIGAGGALTMRQSVPTA